MAPSIHGGHPVAGGGEEGRACAGRASATIRDLAEAALGERERLLSERMAALEGHASSHGGDVVGELKALRRTRLKADRAPAIIDDHGLVPPGLGMTAQRAPIGVVGPVSSSRGAVRYGVA